MSELVVTDNIMVSVVENNETSTEEDEMEMRLRKALLILQEKERENQELQLRMQRLAETNRQLMETPLNKEAYRYDLKKMFIAFAENRLRFQKMLEDVCDKCIAARRRTNVMTVGVGTVGIVAALQKFARNIGASVSVLAVVLNTVLAVKEKFDEAAEIGTLKVIEETDFKLIGQLIGAYLDFCNLFNIPKRVGDEDVWRLHISDVVSEMVKFVEGCQLEQWRVAASNVCARDVIEYGCSNAIFPIVAKIGSSALPDSLEGVYGTIDALSLPVAMPNVTSAVQMLGVVANGFYVANALSDILNGSESDAVKRMKSFIRQQNQELELFRGAVNDGLEVTTEKTDCVL